MIISDRAAEIADEFSFLDNWEDRYAHIIDLGRSNSPLADSEKNDVTRVRGCASQVWLVLENDDDQAIRMRAESDALIVSGLIALLVRLYSGARCPEILAFDAKDFLRSIGVTDALSAQRSNGLNAMLKRIHDFASAHAVH